MKRTAIRELREQRAKVVTSMREITDNPQGTGGDLSEDQQKRFDELRAEVTAVEKRIERQEFIDEAERRMQGEQISGTGDRCLDDELRSFSLVRAIASQVPDLAGKIDFGREVELSNELQRRSGQKAKGIMCPMQIFEKRVMTTALPSDGPGSNIIATDHRGDLYIDALRAALTIRRLGARVITGLVGNVDIPKLKDCSTAGWVAENSALTAGDMKFTKVSLTPKHCGCLTEFSRNMLMQTSPDIEQLVRDDFAKVLAGAVDSVAIKGGGTNEPSGILETDGIGTVALGDNGGALTFDSVASLVSQVEIDDAIGSGFLTNFIVKGAASILKDSNENPYGLDKVFQGYPRAFSNLVPSNLTKGTGTGLSALIFGLFSDLILGYWSEFDLLVNPYESTAYAKGNVQVRGMLTMDMAVRHAESFAAITDIK